MISNIQSLTENFFEIQDFDYKKDVALDIPEKEEINLSYFIEGFKDKDKELGGTIGVIIKEKIKACDCGTILKAEKIGTKIPQLLRMIVIANQFSSTARELADNLGVVTLTHGELESIKSMYHHTKPVFDA